MELPTSQHLKSFIEKIMQFYDWTSNPISNLIVKGCLIKADALSPDMPMVFEDCKFEGNVNNGEMKRIEALIKCDWRAKGTYFMAEKISQCCFSSEVSLQSPKNLLILDETIFEDKITTSPTLQVTKCKIQNIILQGGTLTGSHIEIANVNNAQELVIERSNIKSLRLQNCGFNERAIFSDTVFEEPITSVKSDFSSKNVHFGNVAFKDVFSNKALGSFRQLKHSCEEAGYETGAILFHGFELETHYNIYLKKNCPSALWPEMISSLFNREFTDYGRNLMRPFWILGLLTILVFLYDWILTNNISMPNRELILAKLAFKNSLGPLIFALPHTLRELDLPTLPTKMIAFVQISTSSIIWFLIVFMIRRRFKL